MKSWALIVVLSTMACGGKVADDSATTDASTDAVTSKKPGEEPPSSDSGSGPSFEDAAPTPVADAVPAEDVAPRDAGPAIASCEDGPASGPPMGCGLSGVACSGTDITDAVRAKLACLVDRCLAEMGRPPFCGKIALGLGADGCTNDYLESDSAGGCVKYQGYYRSWPCAAGKRIEIERPCPY